MTDPLHAAAIAAGASVEGADWLVERAAILQYDAGLSRDEAERLAQLQELGTTL